ncbi:MAG: glycosyltransferase [Ruminococcaceae bacterium]|nr:glycosyltransferase [Oscillospiraceae bacterium]
MKREFAVILSVYRKDQAAFVKRALESIWQLQTVRPAQIVLMIDGPVGEDILAVIDAFEAQCPVLKVVQLPQNVGLGNAMRIAMEETEYEIIARMDSDDISASDRFAQQLRFFEENAAVDVVGGDISEFVGEEDHIVAYRRVPEGNEAIKRYLKKRCPLNHVTVMFKKSAVLKAGGYIEQFWNEDYYLWIRMAQSGAVMANTGTVLVNVRTGKDMYSRRGGKKYFQSELFLQNYMLKRKMISLPTYIDNVAKRWIMQRVLPNRIRGWVFRTLARKGK